MTDPARAKRELLRRRAEQLAAPETHRAEAPLELMVFSLGQEQYAFELSVVRAVLRDAMTPMPGVSASIAGAMNVRGALVSVLELRRLLGSSPAPDARERSVLLLESSFGPVGCRVDGLPELRRAARGEYQASTSQTSATQTAAAQAGLAVRGIVAGTIALLDPEAFLSTMRGGA